MISIREQVAAKLAEKFDVDRPESGQMIVALHQGGKHIYAGTVPRAEVERRRAANKRARRSRRVNRMRGAA